MARLFLFVKAFAVSRAVFSVQFSVFREDAALQRF
jgi:hypothetical protein